MFLQPKPWLHVVAGGWIVFALSVPLPAQPPPRGDQAVARPDRNSQLAHEQLLEKARSGRIDVYFLGDSITRRWGATDYPAFLAHWKKSFHGWNAGNFGWGADTIQNILWRIEHGELDGVHPRVIVLLAGTNNIGRASGEGDASVVEEIAQGMRKLIDVCRSKAPAATVVLMAIFPRNDRAGAMSAIGRANRRLSALDDGKSVRFLDINAKLADQEGKLRDGVTVDKLHLSLAGYEIWADALRPILTELLGPPAAADHAPAPTGDPSASRKGK